MHNPNLISKVLLTESPFAGYIYSTRQKFSGSSVAQQQQQLLVELREGSKTREAHQHIQPPPGIKSSERTELSSNIKLRKYIEWATYCAAAAAAATRSTHTFILKNSFCLSRDKHKKAITTTERDQRGGWSGEKKKSPPPACKRDVCNNRIKQCISPLCIYQRWCIVICIYEQGRCILLCSERRATHQSKVN